jgi:hypothetical protein
MVWAFQALTAIWIGKVRLIQKTNTQKQSLYFSEKLFEMIKYGGTIDYEEYFNRKAVNSTLWPTTTYLSGHYIKTTGFWNFWPWGTTWSVAYNLSYYKCISPNSGSMWTDWCMSTANNTLSNSQIWRPQWYGQYSFQFIDYNSNADLDLWDEDWDNNIIWDDDDEYLGEWPTVFDIDTDTKELYLINGVKRERTFFRYNVKLDPHHPGYPNPSICTTLDNNATYTWSGCLGTIEYLKLEGIDYWLNHTNLWFPLDPDSDGTQFDGVIDTWLIDEDFSWNDTTVAHSYNFVNDGLVTNDAYWQPLFPENINVTEFKVFPHPNIDLERAWKESDINQNVAEYVRIQLGMKPAWKDRKMLKWEPKEYKFSTTINLTDIFTQ